MVWSNISLLLSGLIINLVASLMLMRWDATIRKMSHATITLACAVLFGVAFVLATAPGFVQSLDAGTLRTMQAGLKTFLLSCVFNAAGVASAAATVFLLSPDDGRTDYVRRTIGPLQGAYGVGSSFVFAGALAISDPDGSPTTNIQPVLWPLVLMALAVVVVRQSKAPSLSAARFSISMCLGGAAFGQSIGYMNGYLEGVWRAVRELLLKH
jgi:hypothetical protein